MSLLPSLVDVGSTTPRSPRLLLAGVLPALFAFGCAHPGDALIGRSVTPTVSTVQVEFDDADPSALQVFEKELAAYGMWTVDEVAGTVWIPHPHETGADFVPFASHGHFAYREGDGTTPEWFWVSDVAWGWATSHYGRWTYLAPSSTWAWVPGRRYSPAWVTFRVGEGCTQPEQECVIGWGPRAPHFAWRGEEAVRRSAKTTLFVYARAQDLFEEDLSSRLLSGEALMAAAGSAPHLSPPPRASALGIHTPPAPPATDAGLRKAMLLATPDSTQAMGVAPYLGRHTFSTYVTGGPRYYMPATYQSYQPR